MNKDERVAELQSKLADDQRTDRLWIRGAYEELPVYRAPTDLLYLNDDNRRFRAEAQGVAADLNRALDPRSNSEDEESIISLLLDRKPVVQGDKVTGTPSKEAKALLADWEKRGQEQPFWIRPDGLVLNGNRRLAMIKREQARQGSTYHDWVEVLVFSEDEYDDDVLFDLESTEQLTEGLKVRYSDINVLLTLRDAAEQEEVDWGDRESIKTVAARIQHLVNNDPNYAVVQLNAIKYIDLYLEEIGCRGEYHRVSRMVERFREVGKTTTQVADDDPSREDTVLAVMFAAIETNKTHGEIRVLRRMWKTQPEEFDKLYSYIDELEAEAEEHPEPEPEPEPEPIDLADDDDDGEGDVAEAPSAPDYPTRSVGRALNTAIETVQDAKGRDKRSHILSSASRLEAITVEDVAGQLTNTAEGREVRNAVTKTIAWADAVRRLVENENAQGS